MVSRIRKGARAHVYLDEWCEHLGLTHEQLGLRVGVARNTIWRWSKEQWRLDPPKLAAIADAMGLEDVRDLFRRPERPSIDAVLHDAPDEVFQATLELARRLNQKAS